MEHMPVRKVLLYSWGNELVNVRVESTAQALHKIDGRRYVKAIWLRVAYTFSILRAQEEIYFNPKIRKEEKVTIF